MPKIYEYFGFIFFFYSNEHEPIHVHVLKGESDAVFDIILENGTLKEIKARKGKRAAMSVQDIATAEAFVKKFYKQIIDKWINFFILKKAVRSTKITKRV